MNDDKDFRVLVIAMFTCFTVLIICASIVGSVRAIYGECEQAASPATLATEDRDG